MRVMMRLLGLGIACSCMLLNAMMVHGTEISCTDYPSIQAAIDANPGKEIHIPAGDHSIDATIRISSHGTTLTGSGRVVMKNPGKHILEIEHARRVRISGLTFTRAEGAMETQEDGIRVSDAQDVVLEQVQVIDNRTRAASIRFVDVQNGRILNCDVRNYTTIAIDDRTAGDFYGYAFRCIDGTGIVCNRCQGTLIQGNRIIEENLRPTPEIKEKHKLGSFTKKNPTKGSLTSQAVWDAEYVNNWHQGSALIVTGPTSSDFTRILGNHIQNAAQGIDIHSDHVVISNNILDNNFIGMKAMHGSRNVIVSSNHFSRSVLWVIGMMSGVAADEGTPAKGDQPAVPANVDGGSLIANNVISQFGYGESYWMWTDASRAVIRFDNGQDTTDPPLRDVMITGNVISNPEPAEVPEADSTESIRYHYAVRIEGGLSSSPRGLHFTSNLFPAGTKGVANIELPQ